MLNDEIAGNYNAYIITRPKTNDFTHIIINQVQFYKSDRYYDGLHK